MRYLMLTAHHDYRTPRRSNIHFIADELAKTGTVRFFSMRYSFLSKRKDDMRVILDKQANAIERINGIECYLWKTPIHPFNMRRRILRRLENMLFSTYRHLPNSVLKQWITDSDVIIYESGITPIFFDAAKRLNPAAKHIYLGNDDLRTINVAEYAYRAFTRAAKKMDAVCVVSKSMAKEITNKENIYYVPHGLDESLALQGEPSPYDEGNHAVSVGSMLFDASYFVTASRAFPEITFHVIGSGQPRSPAYGDNVIVYGHMQYDETIRYIKHAQIGIAPYISENVPVYLADSSMKMMQYDFFSLPTVCPFSVVGEHTYRFGYIPGNAESIIEATRAAMVAPHRRARKILSWAEVTNRLINPANYQDTKIN